MGTQGCKGSGTAPTVGDPQLGPLQNNGGPTQTHALLAGRPAVDAGSPDGCVDGRGRLQTDQRGFPRPVDGDGDRRTACDIGALELNAQDVSGAISISDYADLNGDGKTDLISQGWDNRFWVSLSTGTGFTSPTLWMDHGGSLVEGQAQYADLNGDGKVDLIFQGVDNTFWVSLSTGTGFTSPALWMDHGLSFIEGQAQYVDLNGDGKADLVFLGVDNNFWISISTGSGFTAPHLWF